MINNTKFLIFFSFFIVIIGLAFVFLGLKPTPQVSPQSRQVEIVKKETSQSGILQNLVTVTKVIDGDTIEIETGEHVRYIGIDTPETVDPKRPVGCFGKEASDENKKLVEGKRVILEKDKEEKDKYGRLLRYIFLPLPNGQTLFVDDYLIREGFGKLLIIPPDDKYKERFTNAQTEARNAKRGLWGTC